MKSLLVFIGLFFLATTIVWASSSDPTCNDPDFRCRKACKSAKDSKKSRRLKSTKKARNGRIDVKDCDWIGALPNDEKLSICNAMQRGNEISHHCPGVCMDTFCKDLCPEADPGFIEEFSLPFCETGKQASCATPAGDCVLSCEGVDSVIAVCARPQC